MASPFDSAWAAHDAVLEEEMGEAVCIGEVEMTAVVPEVTAGSTLAGGMVRNSGVEMVVLLSRAELDARAGGDAEGLKGKKVRRGAFTGRVLQVRDLAGAGAELLVGPMSGR